MNESICTVVIRGEGWLKERAAISEGDDAVFVVTSTEFGGMSSYYGSCC